MYLHPTSAAGRGDGTQGLDRAGLMQYGVVGGIITMYASYAVDFAVFERAAVLLALNVKVILTPPFILH